MLEAFFEPPPDAVHFINVMFATFCLGVFLIARDIWFIKTRLPFVETDYANNSNQCAHDSPDVFLRASLPFERSKQRIAPIPGILVTLGILGTFIGIGGAVGSAIPALERGSNPESVRRALHALLENVKFKFITSAWGICFSLLFIVVTMIAEQWLTRIHLASTVRIAPYRRTTASTFGDAIRQALESAFDQLNRGVRDSLGELPKAALNLSESVSRMDSFVRDFGDTVKRTSSDLSASAQRLGSLGNEINKSLEKVGASLSQATQAQHNTLTESLNKMQESFAQGLHEQQKQQKLAASEQKLAAGELRELLDGNLRRVHSLLYTMEHTLRDGMTALGKYQSEGASALTRLVETQAIFASNLGKLMDIMDREREHSAQRTSQPQGRDSASSAVGRAPAGTVRGGRGGGDGGINL
jgi:hypothetical protein